MVGQEDVRSQFEAWHREKFKTSWQTGAPTRDMHNGVYADNYGPAEEQVRWEAWQAALSGQPCPPMSFDLEPMLAVCVPGGDIADPQVIADNIRHWFAAQPSPGGQDALATARELLAAEYDKAGERVFADRARKGRYDNDPDVRAIVAALAARQPVGEPREGDDFLAGICVALQCVTAQDCGVLWREIVVAVGIDDLLQYATFIEPEEWELAGFGKYASAELGRRKPRRKASKQSAAAPAQAVDLGQTFQAGVAEWMGQCFLPSLYSNMTERGDRLLEEVLELLQAHGYDKARVPTLVDYVFGRPVGDPTQEVGGVMVTLAGYCWVAGLDMHAAGDAELARISQPDVMAKIRAKQEAKNALHFDTPLPGNAAAHLPAQAVDLGPVRAALDAAEGLAVVCASVDGYSLEEVAASGLAMRKQFTDARALIDGKAVGK